MEKKHRVLIVEDQPLLRSGLCRMVSELDDYCIVGEAGGGIEARRLAGEAQPDLILMDLTMPGGSGFDAIASIRRDLPAIRIVVLTVHWSEDHVQQAYAAGADGYVVKDASFEQLVREMRVVMQGERERDRICRGSAYGSRETIAHHAQLWNALTGRERTVLRLVVEGHTNREVGECLSLSPKTIEKHRANLMRKLGIRNLNGLVRLAIDMGVLTAPDDEHV